VWRVGSIGKSPAAAASAINTDSVDWTMSLKSPSVERHNVEAEVIAACRNLTNQPTELTSVPRNRLQETKPRMKSTSEISIAQVLASMSGSSTDPQLQLGTKSSCLVSVKKTPPSRRGPASAGKNDQRNSRVRKNNSINAATNAASANSNSAQLSTINMSDINAFRVPDHLSPISKRSLVDSAPSLPNSVRQSVTVTSSTMPIASSSKHACYRPMKPPSEVNITYDETTKRYVQTVKKSTDRRKSLAFPGSQFDSSSDMSSCRRSLPLAVAVGNSAETTANEVVNEDVPNSQRRRLSLRKNADVSTSGSLLASDDVTSDLSSMEIVTRCCLGTSETPTPEQQQSQPVHTTKLGSALPRQAKRTRSKSSLPPGDVSKYSTVGSEPGLLTGNSSSATDKVEPSVIAPSDRKFKKGGHSDKIAAKDHPTEKGLEKPRRRTSPRRSSDPSPVGSVEVNSTRKPRGRPRTKKLTETSEEKKRGRNGRRTNSEDPQAPVSAEHSSPVGRRQSASRKNNKRNDCWTDSDNNIVKAATGNNDNVELRTINMSDVGGLSGPVQSSSVGSDPASGAPESQTTRRKGKTTRSKVQSLGEKRTPGSGLVDSPVRRKRRQSSLGENAEAEQTVENVVRLPDIECFLTGPPQNSVNTETATDSVTSKNIADDGCLQQNSCPSTQPVISAVGSADTEENTDHTSPPGGLLLTTSASAVASSSRTSANADRLSLPNNTLLPRSTAVSSTAQISSAYSKHSSLPNDVLLPTTTCASASNVQISSTYAEHSSSISSSLLLPSPTAATTCPSNEQILSTRAEQSSLPSDELLPSSTPTHSSSIQTSSTVSISESSPPLKSSEIIGVSADEVDNCPAVIDVGQRESERDRTSSQSSSHSVENHVSITESNRLSSQFLVCFIWSLNVMLILCLCYMLLLYL